MVYARRRGVANRRTRVLLAACLVAGCSAPNPRFGRDQDGGADGTLDGRTTLGDEGSADGQRGTAGATGSTGTDIGDKTTMGSHDTAGDPNQTSDTGPSSSTTTGPALDCELQGPGLIKLDAIFVQMQGDLCSTPLLFNTGSITTTAAGFEHISGCGGCQCTGDTVVAVDFHDTLVPPVLPACGQVFLWGEDHGQGCEVAGVGVIDQRGNPVFLGANTRSVPVEFVGGLQATFGTEIEGCDGECVEWSVGRYTLHLGDVEIGPDAVDIPALLPFDAELQAFVTYREAMVLDGCEELVSWTATFE